MKSILTNRSYLLIFILNERRLSNTLLLLLLEIIWHNKTSCYIHVIEFIYQSSLFKSISHVSLFTECMNLTIFTSDLTVSVAPDETLLVLLLLLNTDVHLMQKSSKSQPDVWLTNVCFDLWRREAEEEEEDSGKIRLLRTDEQVRL